MTTNSIDKNLFVKLNIRDAASRQEYHEVFSSHSVFVPSLDKVTNLAGLTFLSLANGKVEVKLKGKFILEEMAYTSEELNSTVYLYDAYKTQNNSKKIKVRGNVDKNILEEIDFLEIGQKNKKK